MSEKLPIRIRASEQGSGVQFSAWVLPEVGSSHVIGLAEKEELPVIASQITVLEDEVDSSALMTLAEIEVIREQAYEEGFAKGREDGHQFGLKEGQQRGLAQGLEEGQQQIKAQLGVLEQALISLQDPLEQQREKVTELIVEMVEHVAAAVIDYEVKANPEIVAKAFSRALELLPKQAKDVIINVNPAEKNQIQSLLKSRQSHWQVVADEDVSQGGCSIKSGASLIEYQLDSRFQAVVEELYERLYEPPQSIVAPAQSP